MKLVVFEVRGQKFALPADAVRQVNDAGPVAPLPFVPDYVEGLAAVGGQVLPQIDLALRLGMAGGAELGHELIVVDTGSGECVFRVDHARRIATVGEEELSRFGAEDGDAGDDPAEMAAGEFTLDGDTVVLLRPRALGIADVEPVAPQDSGSLALFGEAGADNGQARADSDLLACLEVRLGAERYAFPLDQVSEVYIDAELTGLPNAPGFVRGLSVRRGTPRMVLSLGRLLGLPVAEEGQRVVMTQVHGLTMGFLCDAFVGIRRYPADRREAAGDASGTLLAYLMGEDGAVTALLDLNGLLDEAMVEQLRPHYPRAKETAAAAKAVKTQRMLLVRAGEETCAIEVDRVVRVADYTPPAKVPGAGDILLGMVEIGGDVLPVADVVRAVNGSDAGETGSLVVVRTRDGAWALRVTRPERLVDVPVDAIRPAASGVSQLIGGVGRHGDRLISLLDIDMLDSAEIVPAALPPAAVAP